MCDAGYFLVTGFFLICSHKCPSENIKIRYFWSKQNIILKIAALICVGDLQSKVYKQEYQNLVLTYQKAFNCWFQIFEPLVSSKQMSRVSTLQKIHGSILIFILIFNISVFRLSGDKPYWRLNVILEWYKLNYYFLNKLCRWQ